MVFHLMIYCYPFMILTVPSERWHFSIICTFFIYFLIIFFILSCHVCTDLHRPCCSVLPNKQFFLIDVETLRGSPSPLTFLDITVSTFIPPAMVDTFQVIKI